MSINVVVGSAEEPDPGSDFDRWSEWREQRARTDAYSKATSLDEAMQRMPVLLAEAFDEVDEMREKLGIPVSSTVTDAEWAETIRRLIALDMAMSSVEIRPAPEDLDAEGRSRMVDDLFREIDERAEAILEADRRDESLAQAESEARNRLASYVEAVARRRRREESRRRYLSFGSRVRRGRTFSRELRPAVVVPMLRPATSLERHAGRPRERQASSRPRAPSRGASEDASELEESDSSQLRTEGPRTERLSTESLSAGGLSAGGLSAETKQGHQLRTEPFACSAEHGRASALGNLSERAMALLRQVPTSREGKGAWLRSLARDAEVSIYLARSMGVAVSAIDEPFASPFHPECAATLTRGRNGEIVYRDRGFATIKREFQTLPELAAALRSGKPKRLRPLLHAAWRVRMLFEARLVELPIVSVPALEPGSSQSAIAARAGFELLIRCRWFLESGSPVPFTRAFAEVWCPLERGESRRAIYELLRQRAIVKVDQISSNYPNPTHLYLPAAETVALASRAEAV